MNQNKYLIINLLYYLRITDSNYGDHDNMSNQNIREVKEKYFIYFVYTD